MPKPLGKPQKKRVARAKNSHWPRIIYLWLKQEDWWEITGRWIVEHPYLVGGILSLLLISLTLAVSPAAVIWLKHSIIGGPLILQTLTSVLAQPTIQLAIIVGIPIGAGSFLLKAYRAYQITNERLEKSHRAALAINQQNEATIELEQSDSTSELASDNEIEQVLRERQTTTQRLLAQTSTLLKNARFERSRFEETLRNSEELLRNSSELSSEEDVSNEQSAATSMSSRPSLPTSTTSRLNHEIRLASLKRQNKLLTREIVRIKEQNERHASDAEASARQLCTLALTNLIHSSPLLLKTLEKVTKESPEMLLLAGGNSKEALNPFRCELSGVVMSDPVCCNGDNYERRILQAWYDNGKHVTPFNQMPISVTPSRLPANSSMKKSIQDLVKKAQLKVINEVSVVVHNVRLSQPCQRTSSLAEALSHPSSFYPMK